jgi:mono/diheme cytochrome c family protein
MKQVNVAILAAVGAGALGAAVLRGQAPAVSTTNDGVFSQAQVIRGAEVYQQACASCHDAQLTGSGTAPALTGADFNANWNGETLGAFFERVVQTMPADNPGSLSRGQTAELVAFMLNFNQYPAGPADLPTDATALDAIKIAPAVPRPASAAPAVAAPEVSTAAPAPAPSTPPAPGRTTKDGVFSQAQVTRGGDLYQQACASCHDAQLIGSSTAPALTGADFNANWTGETVGSLFDRVLQTMPGDNPGSLSRAQTADLIAFMLNFNKYPAGALDLPVEEAALTGITIVAGP